MGHRQLMNASNLPKTFLVVAFLIAPRVDAQSPAWMFNPTNGHAYALTPPLGWAQAEAHANGLGAHLVTIRSAAEQAWIWQTFGTTGLWIGYTDQVQEGVWQWTSGEPTTYTNWQPGEPNNASNEDFANLSGNGWNDVEDTIQIPGIMELSALPVPAWLQSPINGHYYATTIQMSWGQAEAFAQSYGGHLATIRSTAENAWAATTFSSGSEVVWIGLNDAQTEGVFEWSSGEPVTYTHWAAGEPTNGNGVEDWVGFGTPWGGPAGYDQWNDNPDTATSYGWPCRGLMEVASLPPPATYSAFGAACAHPPAPLPTLAPLQSETPRLGSTSHLRLSGLAAGIQVPVFVLGFSDTQNTGPLGAHPLPFELSPLGFPGCWQYVSDDSTQFTLALNGYADWQITLPSNSILAGFRFYVQAAVPDALTGSVSVSNAIGAVIGY